MVLVFFFLTSLGVIISSCIHIAANGTSEHIYPDKTIISKGYLHPYVHRSTIHNSQELQTA